MTDKAIKVEHLSKSYQIYKNPADRLKQMIFGGNKKYYKEFKALEDVSFEVNRGEVLGIIGRNGSGKSTLLQLICNTLENSGGSIVANGRISALLELGSGFNVEFTGKENIYLNGAVLGLSQKEIDAKYSSIVEFSGIKDHIDQPVKTYSSGMYVRLAFAVAIATDPDILIVDEALAVGDEIFQRKCFAHFEALVKKGATIIFVSHSARMITKICDRVLLIDRGQRMMLSGPKETINYYHKLIYAPEGRAAAVREEILSIDRGKATVRPKKSMAEPSSVSLESAEESFVAQMLPETTIRNENKNVYIKDIATVNEGGDPVNMLKMHRKYKLNYTVEFDCEAENVRFNLRIRNKEGTSIAGANSGQFDPEMCTVYAGASYQVSFDFDSVLLPETYFVEVGCSSQKDGVREPLARITDAIMFKILPEPEIYVGGIVDIGLTPKIKEV